MDPLGDGASEEDVGLGAYSRLPVYSLLLIGGYRVTGHLMFLLRWAVPSNHDQNQHFSPSGHFLSGISSQKEKCKQRGGGGEREGMG